MVVVDSDPRIVVGIDFGTTFSGAAWARSGKPELTATITNWPTKLRGNHDVEKAPTQIAFAENHCLSGPLTIASSRRQRQHQNLELAEPVWGFNIPAEQAALKWFKLLLLEDKDIPDSVRNSHHLKDAKAALAASGKKVIEVVSAYLRALWAHIVAGIKRSIGDMLFNISTIQVVITLPAIWPHYAQARMRQAAAAAGILETNSHGAQASIAFVPEPEAAALATFQDMTDRPDISVGDHVVVCDAGGGTVDIITYEVQSADPLVMRESVRGDGKLCGAIFLDEGFVRLMKLKVGAARWASLSPRALKKFINDEWEHGIKRHYDGLDTTNWQVQLPSEAKFQHGFNRAEIDLTSAEITNVFDPVADDVEDLIMSQVSQVQRKYLQDPKYIILVGGFGRCSYLYSKLCKTDSVKAAAPGVDILQASGDRPWTAICRGAVIRGLMMTGNNLPQSISIASRITRASYGIKVSRQFIDNVDPIEKKYWSADELQWQIPATTWFLEIGSDVSETKPIRHGFYQLWPEYDSSYALSNTTGLSFCAAAVPPTWNDDSVRNLCRISWERHVDLSKFPIWMNADGKRFRRVEFEVEMISDGGSLQFEVLLRGEKIAAQDVQVLFD